MRCLKEMKCLWNDKHWYHKTWLQKLWYYVVDMSHQLDKMNFKLYHSGQISSYKLVLLDWNKLKIYVDLDEFTVFNSQQTLSYKWVL